MKNLCVFLGLIICFLAHSQPIDLDTTFGNNGVLIDSSVNESPLAIIFNNNKYFFICNNTILSKNYDGSVNTTFGNNGKIEFASPINTYVTKKGLLIDNYIYIFGQVYTAANNSNKNIFIIKISLQGILDTNFSVNGMVIHDFGNNDENIKDIVITDIGKIVLVGYSSTFALVARLNINGTLDTTFNITGFKFFNTASNYSRYASIYKQGNDFLLVGDMYPIQVNSYAKLFFVAKMDVNGNFIQNFGTNGIVSQFLTSDSDTGSISMQNSKLIGDDLYFYTFYSWSFNNQYRKLHKYNITTNAFYSFNHSLPLWSFDFIVDSTNKIYFTGRYSCSSSTQFECPSNFEIKKIDHIGNLDTNFNATGKYEYNFFPNDLVSMDAAHLCFLHADGKIALAGYVKNPYSQFNGSQATGIAMIRIAAVALTNTSPDFQSRLKIFPNPCSSELTIDFDNTLEFIQFKIYDAQGRLVLLQEGNDKIISVTDLKSGIYFLKAFTENNIVEKKFVKL